MGKRRPPLPRRSGMSQRASRCCKSSMESQPPPPSEDRSRSSSARIAQSRLRARVAGSGALRSSLACSLISQFPNPVSLALDPGHPLNGCGDSRVGTDCHPSRASRGSARDEGYRGRVEPLDQEIGSVLPDHCLEKRPAYPVDRVHRRKRPSPVR